MIEVKPITDREKKKCLGKIQHKTETTAEFALTKLKLTENARMYKCEYCGYYHIGRVSKKK